MASLQAESWGLFFLVVLTRYEKNHKTNIWDSSYLLHVEIEFIHLFLLYEHKAANNNETLDSFM